ncbi:MAG: proline/glycine betaine ABC transporter permease, partial [Burkholderiaceae bacterium]|nr:proline/glycine betaine ABC transporter permease [Burkholderiaceae bacterium]
MFPEIIPAREVRRAIDGFVDHLVTNYADALERLSSPILTVLVWLEQLLRATPWWVMVLAVVAIAWLVSRRPLFSVAMGLILCLLGVLGLWDAGMQTLSLMLMATFLSVLVGIPLGIIMARINWLRSIMLPILDVMQT